MDDDDLIATLSAAGASDVLCVKCPNWAPKGMIQCAEFALSLLSRDIRLGIALDAGFPGTRPKVFALSRELKRLPHVDSQLVVCTFDEDTALHDHRRTEALLVESLDRAKRVLEDGLLGRNGADFNQELEAYWPHEGVISSVVTPGDTAREIIALCNATLSAVGDDRDSLKGHGYHGRARTAYYLPLERSRCSPTHPERLLNWDVVLREITDPAVELLKRTPVGAAQSLLIVLGVPRPRGGRALVAIKAKRFQAGGFLFNARPRKLIPYALERADTQQTDARLSSSVRRARCAVIGCGAVGGHVAHALAWTGMGELLLVDPKSYRSANMFRHVLGHVGVGDRSKVIALQRLLQAHIPSLNVISFQTSADQAISENLDKFRALDALVVAIGNATIPLKLNDDFAEQHFPVPVVYTWLEPYGLGGHAVLVRYDRPGCLRCLFRDDSGLAPTFEFARPGQVFARNELGCHGMYVPYADLDARQTAQVAARLVEQASAHPDKAPWRTSWRGDSSSFVRAGYEVSLVYDEQPFGYNGRIEPRRDCVSCSRFNGTAVFLPSTQGPSETGGRGPYDDAQVRSA